MMVEMEMEIAAMNNNETRIEEEKEKKEVVIGDDEETHLTILKTSVFFEGDGFAAYDCKGEVVFRVDSYGPDVRDRDLVFLMDPSGKCLITLKRKRLSLHHRWEGFEGERKDGQKPIFSVRRSHIIPSPSVTVELYSSNSEFLIEGSFAQRSCNVYRVEPKELVAEVKRKVVHPTTVCTNSLMLGKEVFCLVVKSGFDCSLAMGMILALDDIAAGEVHLPDELSSHSEQSQQHEQEEQQPQCEANIQCMLLSFPQFCALNPFFSQLRF